MAAPQTFRQRSLIRQHDRRRNQRVNVNLLGRFMLEDRREFPCQTQNMSPGSVALTTPIVGRVGERVVAYIDHIGRIEGQIVRAYDGGFAMTINATLRKKDKLAAKLTWLANRHELNLPEDRRHDRATPNDHDRSRYRLPDGREYRGPGHRHVAVRRGAGHRGQAADRLAGDGRQAPRQRRPPFRRRHRRRVRDPADQQLARTEPGLSQRQRLLQIRSGRPRAAFLLRARQRKRMVSRNQRQFDYTYDLLCHCHLMLK